MATRVYEQAAATLETLAVELRSSKPTDLEHEGWTEMATNVTWLDHQPSEAVEV